MKKVLVVIISALFLLGSQMASAQGKFGLELRGGASFATQDLGDAKLNTGFGFEGILSYRFMPHLGGYAGWGWNRFSADESFAGKEVDFEETGYLFGLEFNHPIGASGLSFYIRGGGLYNHIETENTAGDITADSGHGLGWQAGAGIDIPLGYDFFLKPGVKYQSLSRELEIGESKTEVDLTYFSVGLGIAKLF